MVEDHLHTEGVATRVMVGANPFDDSVQVCPRDGRAYRAVTAFAVAILVALAQALGVVRARR